MQPGGDFLLDVSAEWPELAGWTYLEHARRGPVPRSVRAEALAVFEGAAQGVLGLEVERRASSRARRELARLLGGWCSEESIAFTANTTTAMSLCARSLSLGPADRVLLAPGEVASSVLPWVSLREQGVAVDRLPASEGPFLDPVALGDALAALRPRVLVLSAVSLVTGERRDLRQVGALARRVGATVVVDGAQAVGSVRLDLECVDVLCGCSRKWLFAPSGVGFLVVRPELLDRLRVPDPGGGSLSEGYLLDPARPWGGTWRAGAARFEGGPLSPVALAGLAASCRLLSVQGLEVVERSVLARAEGVAEAFGEVGWRVISPGGQARSGVVVAEGPPSTPRDLEARLRAARVVVRAKGRWLRASPHFWTPFEDVERLAAALRSVARVEASGIPSGGGVGEPRSRTGPSHER
ncbi:MAG: aminotransferase class V-fold PLP-dependent enzyme [Planctomycetota bacterium]|nr:MAG: aminotransferase class V-fold PLP-dependent enzyme [Planctomycetota bacterium]